MPKSLVFSTAAALILLAATTAIVRSDDARVPAPSIAVDSPTTAPAGEYHKTVLPLLQKYCYECHGEGMDEGGLEMDAYKSLGDMRADTKTWQKVIQYARTQTMPPPKADQPTPAERETLVDALHRELYQIDPANPDPGRVTVRRLNRTEYRNSVRDLTGVTFDPTTDFPQDDTGYGFDNIGDVLTLPPMLMEKYLAATEKILDQALPTGRAEPQKRSVPALAARASFTRGDDRVRDGFVMLSSAGDDSLSVPIDAAAPADYVVRVLAYAHHPEPPAEGEAGHPPVKLSVMVGDAVARELEVEAEHGKPQWYEARVGVAGRTQVRVAVRRERSPALDREPSGGRLGREQPGVAYVKEIAIEGPAMGAVRRVRADRLEATGSAAVQEGALALTRTDDEAAAIIDASEGGNYVLRVQAYADYAGDEPAKVELLLDGRALKVIEVAAPPPWKASPTARDLGRDAVRAVPRVYEMPVELAPGRRRLALRYLNNLREPENPDPNYRDRNVHVQHMDVVDLSAPPLSPPMTEPLRRLFAKHAPKGAESAPGAAAARAVLGEFAGRVWRRPPRPAEVDGLVKLYDFAAANGEEFHGGVKHAMKAVLLSPSFLFRGEPLPAQPARADDAKGREPIGEYELASRLSYFLWSTTPDDELLRLAERGELRQNLHAQVKRLLASPRADALVENFAGQWLQFRNLDAVHPDRKLFKVYTDRLRDAMIKETQLFFANILREDRSLLDVLTGDYTFVNEMLAKHYGLKDDVKGNEFKRVSLAGTPRRGVITQGSVLTLTSNPARTSPVKRGKWVLENLLGSPPPPPPANIPPLEGEGRELKGTLRQKLEQHRESKACASCHAPLDPIGFGLEHFDPIGAFREKEGDAPVDATSAFVNGPTFTGSIELIELLARTRQKDFYRSVAEASLTFALGRGVEPYDQPAVERIVRDLQANDGKFSSLVFGVVDSVPFQMRRADGSSGAAQARADGITP